jgi:hypothetical protein
MCYYVPYIAVYGNSYSGVPWWAYEGIPGYGGGGYYGGGGGGGYASPLDGGCGPIDPTLPVVGDIYFDGGQTEVAGAGNITDEEAAFIASNSYDTWNHISTNAVIAGIRYAGEDNLGDAQRHAMWSAMNARDVGIDAAVQYGWAHEDFAGNTEAAMDLFNDQVGWNIGRANPGASNDQLAALVNAAQLDASPAGGCQ